MAIEFAYVPVTTINVGTKSGFCSVPNIRLDDSVLKMFTASNRGIWRVAMVTFDALYGYYHIIHDTRCDVTKLVEHIARCDLFNFNDPNIWAEHEWYESYEYEPSGVTFLSVNDDLVETCRLKLNSDCLTGDYHYGFRLTDINMNTAFCYGYGDCLAQDLYNADGSDYNASFHTKELRYAEKLLFKSN